MKSINLARLFLGAASAIALTACTSAAKQETQAADNLAMTAQEVPAVLLETPPAGQLPDGVTPIEYRLDVTTDPAEDGFSGTVEIDVSLDQPHKRIWLHALGPKISSATLTTPMGETVSATFTGDQADGGVGRLDFETPVPAGVSTLKMVYTAPYNFGLAGLYKVTQADRPYLVTQMEAIDARRMLPSFDEPRFKTPWTLTVTAPEGQEVITNGPRVNYENLGDGMVKHQFAKTRPIQSYLVALAVGPYDSMPGPDIPATDLRDLPVPLRGFAAYGKGDKLDVVLNATGEMLLWQESYFDFPYPYGKLDLIAAPDYAYGAMENAGAIVYRESALLVDERTSTSRMRGILTTHAHELGHQWFGNLVTPAWWDDIWLNEAFATWISYKTLHAYDPENAWDRAATRAGIGAMSSDSLLNARQIRNPVTRNGDINDAFDSITYRKGGHVLSMFEGYLGEDQFRKGIRLHMKTFTDGVADVDDFMNSLAKGSGQEEVVESFKTFIFQPGIPMLDVQLTCTADGDGQIDVRQSRYAPLGSEIDPDASTWQIPFAARVKGPSGERVIRQMLTRQNTTIPVSQDCPDWVMPNVDGVGYWRFSTSQDNWNALARNHADLSAGEQLAYADNLVAGYSAGRVSAEALLAGLTATTGGAWDSVQLPLHVYAKLEDMLDPADTAILKSWVQDTYGPLYASLTGDGLTQGERILRNRLKSTLINHGEMTDAQQVLAEKAAAYLGVDGTPQPDALTPDELGLALKFGAQSADRAYYDAAVDYALKTSNQREKRIVINALAANGDARIVADIMKRVQGNGFSGNDAYGVLVSAMSNRDQQETAWSIFKASFDNLLPRLPEVRKQQIAGVTGYFCTADEAAAAKAFFDSKADAITGYERSLAQGMERAQLCSALKARNGEELSAALANL